MKRHLINIFKLLIVIFFISGKLYGKSRPVSETDDITKINQLTVGAGWASLGIRDMGLSPLYYNGSHIAGSAGYMKGSATFLSAFNISVLYGTVHPAIYPDLTNAGMSSIKAGGSYSYMRFAGNFAGDDGKLFLGGALNSQFGHYRHNKFANSASNQYYVTSLGLIGLVSYPLNKHQKNFLLVFNMHIPFMAAIVRDGYAYIKPSGFLNHETGDFQSFFQSIDLQFLNKFFSLESMLSVEYRLTNDNSLRIGYRWEYFGHDNYNALKSATHAIFLQTSFNF